MSSNMGSLLRCKEQAEYQPDPRSIAAAVEGTQWLVQGERNFIFNTDLDGIISAALLVRWLNWTPVGICHCGGSDNDGVWLSPGVSLENDPPVFIDMWVAPSRFDLVDQHIVALDKEHAAAIAKYPRKSNPNLYWRRYASKDSSDGQAEYKWKYPFGVVHFIIAALESHDIKVSLPLSDISDGINSFDLLLRADDAAKSTAAKYRSNCLGWWLYLHSMGGEATAAVADYAVGLDASVVIEKQRMVEDWIRGAGAGVKWISKDGNFSRHFRNNEHVFDSSIRNLVASICSAVLGEDGIEVLPEGQLSFTHTPGGRDAAYKHEIVRPIIECEDLFSYAFTYMYGQGAASGFSHSHYIINE